MGPRPARTRRLVAASGFAALAALASPAGAQSQWAPASGQVTRAIDGESIEVKIVADRLEIVRYAGISTPEFHHHRPRPSGVFGTTRLHIYFHPDDSARMILLADPFLHFESPQHAAGAGYHPSMDYVTFARREQKILSGEPLSVTTGGQFAGSSGGVRSRPRGHDSIYLGGDSATIYSSKPPVLVVEPPASHVVPRPAPGYNPPGYIRGAEAYSPYTYPTR